MGKVHPDEAAATLQWVLESSLSADLAALRARIPEFPGYTDEASRYRSDRLVRAYLGRSLSRFAGAAAPQLQTDVRARIDALLLRCAFPDQRLIAFLAHRRAGEAQLVRLVQLDRRLVEDADRIASVAADGPLAPLVDDVARMLDERSAIAAP